MIPINVQELSPRNRRERAHRLEQLRRSVACRDYGVNSDLVARGILREAFLDAASRRRRR